MMRCAMQVSQPLRDPSASQDEEDLVEFETECIARAVAGEAEPEPSVYFLGEAVCTALELITMARLCMMHACLRLAPQGSLLLTGERGCQGCKH